jgi:L-ascorbate metabolism protein UlaG (beta-lactamase superfamily)
MVKVTWLGHAAFKVETERHTFLIDPWIDGNPVSPYKSYKEIKKADFVLVTHDHADHGLGDAVRICKNTKATFIGVFELAEFAGKKGCRFLGGNIGGEVQRDGVKIYFTQAIHSSGIAAPCGFIVSTPEITFYHTGDTAFYSDMEYYSRLYEIDVMMVPICSNYMMGVTEAVWATEKVRPRFVIPCHYNTFPALNADPERFKEKAGLYSRVEILTYGEEKLFEF